MFQGQNNGKQKGRHLSHPTWKIWQEHLASIDSKVKDYLITKGEWESVIPWTTLT